MSDMPEQIADIPQIKRGMVWCRTCGNSQKVNGISCMSNGWPKCCGYTMTIDSPEEQQALSRLKQAIGDRHTAEWFSSDNNPVLRLSRKNSGKNPIPLGGYRKEDAKEVRDILNEFLASLESE